MKVVVCTKQTPSTTAVFSVDNGTVSWDDPGGKPNVVNPWDEYAIEEAIRLKENHGATDAIAISVGEESSQDALKTCLAMGCTEAILVSDASLRRLRFPRYGAHLGRSHQQSRRCASRLIWQAGH